MKNNLDKILIEKKISIRWLVKQLGDRKAISIYKYCSNEQQPNIFTLYKISVILKVRMEDLIDKTEV